MFLYRDETREVARQIGVDVTKFDGPIIPVIYWVNLRDPSGYFLAQTFDMRNKDVIYTSHQVLEFPADDHGHRERPDYLFDQRLCTEGAIQGDGNDHHHHDADNDHDGHPSVRGV